MKTFFFKTLILCFLFIGCSNDDDSNQVEGQQFLIKYKFEGSYGADAELILTSKANNSVFDEQNYDDLMDTDYIIEHQFNVESSEIISGEIKIIDVNGGIRGNGTISIMNSESEVVATSERKYMNTDSPPVECNMILTYNISTGESNLEGSYW
jgi:uncharacterized protein YcfL